MQSWIYLSFVLPDSQSNNNWQPNLYFGFFMKLTHLSLVQYWFIQSYRQVLYTGLSLHETSLIMGIKSKSIYEGGLKSYNGWGSDGLGKLIPKFYANAKVHSSLWISIVWKSVKIDIKVLPTLVCTKPFALPGTSCFAFSGQPISERTDPICSCQFWPQKRSRYRDQQSPWPLQP